MQIIEKLFPHTNQHATLAAKLATEQAELFAINSEHRRLALAAEEGDPAAVARVAKLHKDRAAKEARITDLQAAVTAHNARTAEQDEKARAEARERFEAKALATFAEVNQAAGGVDEALDALKVALSRFEDAAMRLRPYASDEGNVTVARAANALQPCINYRLRGLPGFYGDPALTKDHLSTWAQHVVPSPDGWRRLLAPEMRKG